MLANGKIAYATCYQAVNIPASYAVRLASQAYTTDQEPRSFQAAVDHWLLCEVLNAIGNHTFA